MKRRRIFGFVDEGGEYRELRDPLGAATGAQLARLNRLGMLDLVAPGRAALRKSEAAAAIDDTRGAAELLDETETRRANPAGRGYDHDGPVRPIRSTSTASASTAHEPCWRPPPEGATSPAATISGSSYTATCSRSTSCGPSCFATRRTPVGERSGYSSTSGLGSTPTRTRASPRIVP